VRVRKGLYEGDLARVFKVRKTTVDVLLVPRICVQDIIRRIREETSKLPDSKAVSVKKEELLRLFTDHRAKNYKERPSKRQLFAEDFNELKDIPGVKNIRLASSNGLILLSYHPEELSKVHGTYLPVEVIPFTSEGNFLEELKEVGVNLTTSFRFKVG
jgi:hypothetical protein